MIDPDERRGTDREQPTENTTTTMAAESTVGTPGDSTSSPRRGSEGWREATVARLARQVRSVSRRWRARRRGRGSP
jgi:hypothetical protein